MTEWGRFDWFLAGLAIGFAWSPAWRIIKKIYHEAKIAREQW